MRYRTFAQIRSALIVLAWMLAMGGVWAQWFEGETQSLSGGLLLGAVTVATGALVFGMLYLLGHGDA